MSQFIKAIQSVEVAPNTTLESIYEEKLAFFSYQSAAFIQYLKLELQYLMGYAKQLAPIMEATDLQLFIVMSGNLEWELKALEHSKQLPYLLKKWCESEVGELDNEVLNLLKNHFSSNNVLKSQILALEKKQVELTELSKKAAPEIDEVTQRCLANIVIEIQYLLGQSKILTERGKRLIKS